MRWSTEALRSVLKAPLGSPGPPVRRPTKYRAIRTEVDGKSFASKFEAERYRQLKLLALAGQISGLELQPRFPLRVEGVHICTYVADFGYIDSSGLKVVEDVKGFKTREYGIKKKLYTALYPSVPISEISRRR